jgi:biopolymer transport protein ExbD
MAGAATNQDDEIQGINVTPLVDVMLVLLIIVLVTARAVVSQGMPMDLPKAASAGEVQAMFTVDIDQTGAVMVGRQPVSVGTPLQAMARAARAADPDLRAVIQASRAVSHGRVMAVVDDLREAGLARIAFGAERSAAPDRP